MCLLMTVKKSAEVSCMRGWMCLIGGLWTLPLQWLCFPSFCRSRYVASKNQSHNAPITC